MSEDYDPLDSPVRFTVSQASSKRTIRSISEYSSSNAQPYFLVCLGAAQHFNVDFLPITWQPALNIIGAGATARIHQAPVNAQTDFAFKRFLGSEQSFSAEEQRKLFRALIQEITILSLPPIRRHPNIINLAGLCWDVVSENGSVWPVLVFEKSRHGNLRAFMENGVGRRLGFQDRLKLCADVAQAVLCLHANSQSRSLPLC